MSLMGYLAAGREQVDLKKILLLADDKNRSSAPPARQYDSPHEYDAVLRAHCGMKEPDCGVHLER